MEAKKKVAKNIDEYISQFPPEVQGVLQKVRETIRKAAPKATETISYAIPCYMYHGYLIYFAGFKNHVSVYPAPRGAAEFKDELAVYKGGKGTVQFPLDEPLPVKLIARMVKYRMKENEEKEKSKGKGSPKSKADSKPGVQTKSTVKAPTTAKPKSRVRPKAKTTL